MNLISRCCDFALVTMGHGYYDDRKSASQGLTSLNRSCVDLNIITNMMLWTWDRRKDKFVRMCGHREEDRHWHDDEIKRKNSVKKVWFSQNFTDSRSVQSCWRGDMAFLWFKSGIWNSEPGWGDIGPLQLFQLLAICSPLWLMNWLSLCEPAHLRSKVTSHCSLSTSHHLSVPVFISPPSVLTSFSLFCLCPFGRRSFHSFLSFSSCPPVLLCFTAVDQMCPCLKTNNHTDFPSPDIPDVHCNPSSSSSPSPEANLLQLPKSTSCNH